MSCASLPRWLRNGASELNFSGSKLERRKICLRPSSRRSARENPGPIMTRCRSK